MEEFEFNSRNNPGDLPEEPMQTMFADTPDPVPQKPKKEKKRIGRTIGLIVMTVCISVFTGALGAFWMNVFMQSEGDTIGEILPNGFAQGGTSSTAENMLWNLTVNTSSTTYAAAAAKVRPAVVEITTESVSTGYYFQQYITSGAGSGVIISSDGYIITNNHVIDGASKIMVRLTSGEECEATVVGTDAQSDIAVIKVEANDLPVAVIGDSSKLVVGEEVLAVGNPLGSLGGSVTNGIISALDRQITIDGQMMTLLQTNAAINPGNSGGGLFNLKGELIAITNAKSYGEEIEGLGFSIPINYAYSIAKELIDKGYISGRPMLGITYIEISDYQDLIFYRVNTPGIYVYDGGNTGLKNGDRIVSIGDYEVTDSASLKSALQSYNVGDTVEIHIVRNGRYDKITATLIESTPETNAAVQNAGNP